jgi:hypothetical protein
MSDHDSKPIDGGIANSDSLELLVGLDLDGWTPGTFEDCRAQCPHAKIVRRETKDGESPHRWQDWDCMHEDNKRGPCDPALCPIFHDPHDPHEDHPEAEDRWFPREFQGFYEPNSPF